MTLIDRPTYTRKLQSYVDTPLVKVLTGIRRCGKSSLLKLLATWLADHHATPERVVHLDFDLLVNSHLSIEDVNAQVHKVPEEGPVYILLDEVQELPQWEKLVNSLLAEGRFDLYVTGSNSTVLSSELSTYITGRYVEIPVHTLSFSEHIDFTCHLRGQGSLPAEEWNAYVRRGGFPGLYASQYTDEQTSQIVGDIYRSILVKDILTRYSVRQADLLERVALFALDNVGNPMSARSISAFLKSQQRTLSHPTVSEYLSYLSHSYLMTPVSRYDLRGRGILATFEKYYPGDHGLVNALLGYSPTRLPGLLESIVWSELVRRGYEVHIGRDDQAEVDFVADKEGRRLYIQVAASILDPVTLDREMRPLLRILDAHPKLILTLDSLTGSLGQGLASVYLPDFLLEDNSAPHVQ